MPASTDASAAPALVLFRDDLRVIDNPALAAAAATGRPLLCVYVLDEASPGIRPLGGAARWWLHGALADMARALGKYGVSLHLLHGPQNDVLMALVEVARPAAVFWNRRYGGAERTVDAALKDALKGKGIEARSFCGHLLHEPWEVRTGSGGAFKVFTPFWRAAQALPRPDAAPQMPRRPTDAPWPPAAADLKRQLDDLRLRPAKPDWAGGLRDAWDPTETGARQALDDFFSGALDGYASGRDRPDMASTSRLSPYLRFGQIPVRHLWHSVQAARETGATRAGPRDVDVFHKELGWREFSYHLLYHRPDLGRANFNARFDAFPWRQDARALEAWRRGRTGYPIVDAGMRQLWQTGWMHNRVRMVTASFLIKHLLLDWRLGEAWFWDTLVDADPASNAASWQWVAGSGADAAPYYRIFNPVLQGEKFDPDGTYVRRYVPELAGLSSSVIHQPWKASAVELRQAGVALGADYPEPIIDHATARERALAAFRSISDIAS